MFAAGLRSAAQLFCGALSSTFPARLCQSLGDGSLGSAWFIFAAITKAWNGPFETWHGYRILAPGPGCWLCKLAGVVHRLLAVVSPLSATMRLLFGRHCRPLCLPNQHRLTRQIRKWQARGESKWMISLTKRQIEKTKNRNKINISGCEVRP